MKKFSTSIIVVLAILTVIALASWRGARGTAQIVNANFVNTSNKLAEVTAKLAEQGAANETLRVQLKLQTSDLGGATNHIAMLTEKLSQTVRRARDLEQQLQHRDTQIAALETTNSQFRVSIGQCKDQVDALQSELATARAGLAEISSRFESTRLALNESEREKVVLMQKFNDPSVWRAQLKAVTTPTHGQTARSKGPLKLQPDGTILLDSSPPSDADGGIAGVR